jgi:DNA-binding CsgD family transcriptional regulator
VHDSLLAAATAALTRPGLVVVTGAPGAGRSTVLRRLSSTMPGPAYSGGGLAMLTTVPALALSRAVRARLPHTDTALLAEAVRSRVRGGLLVLDDLQYADTATLAALPAIAVHCRVLVALRTPHRLPSGVEDTLRAAATAWLAVPPLGADDATQLARRAAPQLSDAAIADVVARAGGTPLAVDALARHAAAGRGTPSDVDQVAYAFAAALADLPRPARTAMAALGLLARPASTTLLGPGAADLLRAGLAVTTADGTVTAVSTYLADIAAGLLDPAARAELHRRLADLTPAHEAARHLAAAGDHPAAYRHALHAADQSTGADRAALLLYACDLPGVTIDPRVRLAAADAALTTGRPAAAARVLTTPAPLGVEADVLRGEAHLQAGDPYAARAAVRPVPDAAAPAVVAARDRILLLADLATQPDTATDTAAKIAIRHPQPPPGVAAALAAVAAAHRAPGWDTALAAAAAGPDPLTARWSAWLLVDHLTADGRLTDAAHTATTAARACAADQAYSWQTRFLAAAHWATALHGSTPDEHTDDTTHRYAADLLDRTLPADARAHATAATALVEADTGLLAAARTRLAAHHRADGEHPSTAWVTREAAWLDGQPDKAADPPPAGGAPLLTGLHHITARWARHDGAPGTPAPPPPGLPDCARQTLTAWATGTGFTTAADTWQPVATREQIRCLIAAGLHDTDPDRAVPALLAAEDLATRTGLVVLAGRARRALRRHHIRRDTRSTRSGTELTGRERDVLTLVAAGEPTRRIAGQLGISTETVDTHIRAAMRKLGARTRTEAAARAFTTVADSGEDPW